MKLITIDSESEWRSLLDQCLFCNFWQSSEFAAAMQTTENVRPVRQLLEKDGSPFGIVQTLVGANKLGIPVGRIYNGPLFFHDSYATQDKKEVIEFLTAITSYWGNQVSFLYFFPNVLSTLCSLNDWEESGLTPAADYPWASIRLDLSKTEEELRAGLKGNWRNKLKQSEKKGVELEVSRDSSDVDEFFRLYEPIALENNYGWPPMALANAVMRESWENDSLYLLWGLYEGERVCASANIRVGATVHNFLVWNTKTAFQTRANHYALWRSILFSRDRGCRWFDMGGVYADRHPGFTTYKRGVGGEEYCLVQGFTTHGGGLVKSAMAKLDAWLRSRRKG